MLLDVGQTAPVVVRHVQDLVAELGQQPVFQLGVGRVLVGVMIKMRWTVHFYDDRTVLAPGYVAIFVTRAGRKAAF